MVITNLSKAKNGVQYGGKAASLAHMIQRGINVPSGFVVSNQTDAFSEAEEADILEAFDALGAPFVAVRSSALAEDGANASWAGQLETILNVDRSGVVKAAQACFRSTNSKRALAYAKQHNIDAGRMAVVVQAMIQSDFSGVAFSVHPVTRQSDQIVIEAVQGLGEALVSGMVTPDTYIIQKSTCEMLAHHAGDQTKQLVRAANNGVVWKEIVKQQSLSTKQIRQLSALVISLEEYYGFPVDVEWGFVDNAFYVLQSRPITTLT